MLVHEQVDVAAHLARLVADAAVQRWVASLELLERGTHTRGRKGKLRGAPGAGAQRRWNKDRDAHAHAFLTSGEWGRNTVGGGRNLGPIMDHARRRGGGA